MDTTYVIILCSFTLSCYEYTRYRQCILAVTFFCFVATLCVIKDVYIKVAYSNRSASEASDREICCRSICRIVPKTTTLILAISEYGTEMKLQFPLTPVNHTIIQITVA